MLVVSIGTLLYSKLSLLDVSEETLNGISPSYQMRNCYDQLTNS